MSKFLIIDGGIMEGGGQILRISISLSAVLGVPVRVINIRAGRNKPGLAAQHLKGIELVAEMCHAKLRGARIGSMEIDFTPQKIRGGYYASDPRTAGSICLILQVALPVALFADSPVTLDLKGGTNADMAPQVEYMTEVFRRVLQNFNADFSLDLRRKGFYPRGGGHVRVEVNPLNKLQAVNIVERGTVKSIRGASFVSGTLPIKLAEMMSEGATEELRSVCEDVYIHSYKEDKYMSNDSCSGINLKCELSSGYVVGGGGLGKRGEVPVHVGSDAAECLAHVIRSGACLDPYAQDQVIIYMALAEGKSVVRVGEITLHTQTAIHFTELIAKVKFTITPDGDQNLIECTGLGYKNQYLPDE